MKTYEVVTAFPYRGRLQPVGGRVEIEDAHVLVLTVLGKIKEPNQGKQAYKRRDMRPEG